MSASSFSSSPWAVAKKVRICWDCAGASRPGLGDGVHEEAVALVGRDPAGAGVGLDQVALPFEEAHLVADRRRGHRKLRNTRHRSGPHRLGGLDVFLHYRFEDGGFAIVEHVGSQRYRVPAPFRAFGTGSDRNSPRNGHRNRRLRRPCSYRRASGRTDRGCLRARRPGLASTIDGDAYGPTSRGPRPRACTLPEAGTPSAGRPNRSDQPVDRTSQQVGWPRRLAVLGADRSGPPQPRSSPTAGGQSPRRPDATVAHR